MHFVPKKYGQFLFYVLMAFLMSGLMTFVITLFNIGIDMSRIAPVFFAWMRSWAVAFVAALPALMIVTPVVRRLVTQLVVE